MLVFLKDNNNNNKIKFLNIQLIANMLQTQMFLMQINNKISLFYNFS